MSDKDLAAGTLRRLPEAATPEEISGEIAGLAALHKDEAAGEAGPGLRHEEVRWQQPNPGDWARAVAALGRIAERGTFDGIDPVAWQREIRADRPLPGRGE